MDLSHCFIPLLFSQAPRLLLNLLLACVRYKSLVDFVESSHGVVNGEGLLVPVASDSIGVAVGTVESVAH